METFKMICWSSLALYILGLYVIVWAQWVQELIR